MENQTPENDLINALFKERKADRRWKTIRSLIWAAVILFLIVLIFFPKKSKNSALDLAQPYVAMVTMNGEVMAGHNFSAKKVIPELTRAFKDKSARGIVLMINSPGGSPVQASIIHDKIVYLKQKYNKKVVVIGQDVLASAAYLVSTAADKIYVNPDTLTGSIGVVMSGFGFNEAMQKVGVTRRVFTAGVNKDRLDPFKPLDPADTEKVAQVLKEVHQHFIDDVLKGRGSRLKGDQKELFSGDFWTGSMAAQLGIVDGTGNMWEILKNEFNVEHYKDYTTKPSLLQIILSGAEAELHLALTQESNLHLQSTLAP